MSQNEEIPALELTDTSERIVPARMVEEIMAALAHCPAAEELLYLKIAPKYGLGNETN